MDNLYRLMLIKGRIETMCRFVDSLEVRTDQRAGIEAAVRVAYQWAEAHPVMSVQGMMKVYQAFWQTPTVYWRTSRVLITPPTPQHAVLHLPAQVDFGAVLNWCTLWSQAEPNWTSAAQVLYDYWKIHPMDDGNKRCGMIFTAGFCRKAGLAAPYAPPEAVLAIKVALFDHDLPALAALLKG